MISMSNVTRNEVEHAITEIFGVAKPTIANTMLAQWRNWEDTVTITPMFISVASDCRGRTLGKFDCIRTGMYLTLSTRTIPYDAEFDSEFGYSYILECLQHSCGVRNWFRDEDYDYLYNGENYCDGWGLPIQADRETTREVISEIDCIHEWYAMIRAFQDKTFVTLWHRHHSFSKNALQAVLRFFIGNVLSANEGGEE